MNAVLFCGSFLLLLQFAVVVIGWRFRAIHPHTDDELVDVPDPVDAQLDDQPDEVLLRHEAIPGYDEPDEVSEDIHLWAAELAGHAGIEKHLRRMDRWSS